MRRQEDTKFMVMRLPMEEGENKEWATFSTSFEAKRYDSVHFKSHMQREEKIRTNEV